MLKACSLVLLALSGPLLVPGHAMMAVAADAPQEQPKSVATTMAAKGNVRFGPSIQAKVVVTLDPGTPVEVLGIAQGIPEWYVIRFPREGSAWIHEKVIQVDASGKKATVREDRARVRDDSRQGGNIVAELALGEEVEIKERARNGAWVPVYPPSAVAYVHKSVLVVPAGKANEPNAIDTIVEKDNRLDNLWDEAQARYAAFKKALDQNVEIAATLDWDYLDKQLAEVVAHHPSERVKLACKRLKDRIAPVVTAAKQVQDKNGIKPTRDVPGEPAIAKGNTPPGTPDPVKNDPPPNKPQVDPLPKPSDVKQLTEVKDKAPAPTVGGEFVAQGFLEERAIAAVGTNHVIIDKNGKICAFVKTKPGVDLQLSEFFWRNVGVKGETQLIEAAKHGQGGGPIPLVLVEDVLLLR